MDKIKYLFWRTVYTKAADLLGHLAMKTHRMELLDAIGSVRAYAGMKIRETWR